MENDTILFHVDNKEIDLVTNIYKYFQLFLLLSFLFSPFSSQPLKDSFPVIVHFRNVLIISKPEKSV